jgi:LAO/AO transport system kinase
MTLVKSLLDGDRRALARLISQVEDDAASAADALAALFSHTGRAHRVGVTGAPGTGKSALVNQITRELRRRGKTVGIVAVDPSSPFSGGAILGDRIRMRDLSGDPGIFIRSMASRGSMGGLARATANVVKVLDASGFDVVLVETVGVGQLEVDIARHAHTVLVVEAPGLGDEVQAIKAGLLEVADVLAVNKSDDPRAGNTLAILSAMLELNRPISSVEAERHHGRLIKAVLPAQPASGGWKVPVCATNALTGEGVPELVSAIEAHHAYLCSSGELEQRELVSVAAELESLLREALLARLLEKVDMARLSDLVERIARREIVPQAAVQQLLDGL